MKSFSDLFDLLLTAPLHPVEGRRLGLNADEIAGLEKRLNFQLPLPLRCWLMETNATCVGSGGFVGVSPERRGFDIETIFSMYPLWMQLGWIPVAADGSGNYFVILPEEGAVVFVDVAEDVSKPAYVVASSLGKFIEMFIRNEAGERDWPFNKDFVLANDPLIETASRIASVPWE